MGFADAHKEHSSWLSELPLPTIEDTCLTDPNLACSEISQEEFEALWIKALQDS